LMGLFAAGISIGAVASRTASQVFFAKARS